MPYFVYKRYEYMDNSMSEAISNVQEFGSLKRRIALLLTISKKNKKLSEKDIADLLGFEMPRSTFHNYLKNGPSIDTIKFMILLHRLMIPFNLLFMEIDTMSDKRQELDSMNEQIKYGHEIYHLVGTMLDMPYSSRIHRIKAIVHILKSFTNTDQMEALENDVQGQSKAK